MYNIGICDDGKVFCGFMESMILNYIEEEKAILEEKIIELYKRKWDFS